MDYPYCVELPLSVGFNSLIEWFGENNIEFKHYSFLRENKIYTTYYFCKESDAVLFTLYWSGR